MKVLVIAIVLFVILVIGFAVWFFVRKRNQHKQDFLLITGVRSIADASLNIVEAGRYGTDDRNGESWAIREVRQRFDKETGRMVQIVCGWNCNPLDLTGEHSGDIDKDYISALASRVTAESKLGFERKKQRNNVVMWAGIIGVILAAGIVIPLCMMISNGSVQVPVPTDILKDIGH